MAEWDRTGDLPAGWYEFERDDDIWRKFSTRFDFRPSTKKKDWPGIKERSPSTTYKLPIFSQIDFQKTWDLYLECLKSLVRPGQEKIHVLDWHHTSYTLIPTEAGSDWVIHPIPNGDYYIFLEPQFRFGTFGHPWEWSFHVFGDLLLNKIRSVNIPCLNDVLR